MQKSASCGPYAAQIHKIWKLILIVSSKIFTFEHLIALIHSLIAGWTFCGCLGSRCWFKWSLPRRWKGRASVSPLGFGVIEIATCLLTAGGKQLLASMKIIIQVPWRMLSISKNTLPFKCASKCGSFVYERHSCKCAFTYGVVKVL